MEKVDAVMIGSRIKKQREFLGYTREALAEKLNISVNFCRDIEIGAKGMSLDTLVKLSNALKISVDYILNGEIAENKSDCIITMIKSCKSDKLRYLEDIIKSFLLSIDEGNDGL